MYSIFLVLSLESEKRIAIELERNISEEYAKEKVRNTNFVDYQGEEKVIDSFISVVKTTTEQFPFAKKVSIER